MINHILDNYHSSQLPDNIIFVRHARSEGDDRRLAAHNDRPYFSSKDPFYEEITDRGREQCKIVASWILKKICDGKHDFFDYFHTSPTIRTHQTAELIDPNAAWEEDSLLLERNRGLITGYTKKAHAEVYPESYIQMLNDPVNWTPPAGESITDVSERAEQWLNKIKSSGAKNILVVAHRDWMWAAMRPLDSLSLEELKKVNTDDIDNCQTIQYTSINPENGTKEPDLIWKRVINLGQDLQTVRWQKVANKMLSFA